MYLADRALFRRRIPGMDMAACGAAPFFHGSVPFVLVINTVMTDSVYTKNFSHIPEVLSLLKQMLSSG
jgi:hypothetical protein